ncbi:MAG: hypothetical protein ACRDYU_00380 [Actinomycetes bacterium]
MTGTKRAVADVALAIAAVVAWVVVLRGRLDDIERWDAEAFGERFALPSVLTIAAVALLVARLRRGRFTVPAQRQPDRSEVLAWLDERQPASRGQAVRGLRQQWPGMTGLDGASTYDEWRRERT